MKKHSFLSFLFSTLLLSSLGHAKRPNIVFFLVDDMGLMDTSVPMLSDGEGNPVKHPLNDYYRTPNMERLAAQGIRFSQFYAHSVCSPTRNSILTGQNSARHRTTTWISPPGNNKGKFGPSQWNWKGLTKESVTLPRLLQQSGYHTIHVGKAHFGPKKSEGADPLNLGFDKNIAGWEWGAPGSYYAQEDFGAKIKNRANKAVPHLKEYHGTDAYLTEVLTLEAKKLLDEARTSDAPFFLHMSHYAVHSPFESDPRYAENYEKSDESKSQKAFATMIEGMDKSLGDLMDYLEEKSLAENTLIIFLGDNGTDSPRGDNHNISSSAPFRGKKASHYQGGMRVPFIAAWAKPDPSNELQSRFPISQNTFQEQIGTCYDLMPTLLKVSATPLPKEHPTDGRDLWTLFSGKEDPAVKPVFLNHYPHQHRSSYFTSYRSGDWQLIYHYPLGQKNADSQYELFNLKEDPSESQNLATSHPDKLRELMTEMISELEEMNALYPEKGGVPIKPFLEDID